MPPETGTKIATGDIRRISQDASKLMVTEHCGFIMPQMSKLIMLVRVLKKSTITFGQGTLTLTMSAWI